MITTVLLSLVYLIIQAIITMLPSASVMPVGINAVVQQMYNYVASWGWIFPAEAFFTVLNLTFLFFGAVLTFRIARWVFSFITKNPGSTTV